MTKPQRCFFAAALLCPLFFVSCTLPVVRPVPVVYPYITAREAVTALSAAQDKIIDVRGRVTLKTYDENGSLVNSVGGYLAFKNPDKARFTYIGPLGIVLFEALVNDETMILFLPQQLIAYKGSTDTPDGGRFPRGLTKMSFPRLADKICVIEHGDEKSTLYVIAGTKEGYDLSEKIVFSRADMRPLEREVYADGLVSYRVTYTAYEVTGGIAVPTEIRVEDETAGTALAIALSDVKVNTGISDDAFDATVKPPYTEKPLAAFVLPEF
jgi:outer membrane lipoprotein-sorting protein